MPLPVLAQLEEPVDDIAQQADSEMALARGLGLDDHHDGALAVGVEGLGGIGDAFALGLPDRTGGAGLQGGPCDSKLSASASHTTSLIRARPASCASSRYQFLVKASKPRSLRPMSRNRRNGRLYASSSRKARSLRTEHGAISREASASAPRVHNGQDRTLGVGSTAHGKCLPTG